MAKLLIHANIDRPVACSIYIGSLEQHWLVDVVEEYLSRNGIAYEETKLLREDFISWTYHWEERQIALYLSVGRDYRGFIYTTLSVAICFLPAVDRDLASLYLLRLNATLICPHRLSVLLEDIVTLGFSAHTVFLTPEHLEFRLPSLVGQALALQAQLLSADLGFVPFPPSWFEKAGA